MLFLFFLFSIIIIQSVNSADCNSSDFFYPCACCDPAFHHCVHNAANIFSYISSCSIFKIFNPTCKLDTSTYCCVPKAFERIENKKDNITLFNKYCKKNLSLHDPLDSMVNTIISSCHPISKRCYDAKNPIAPALLPIPKRPFEPRILSPPRVKPYVNEVTTKISSIIIEENEKVEENQNQNLTEFQSANKQRLDEVTISIWVPEKIIHKNEEKIEDDDTIPNRAILQFQSICCLMLIAIINLALNVFE